MRTLDQGLAWRLALPTTLLRRMRLSRQRQAEQQDKAVDDKPAKKRKSAAEKDRRGQKLHVRGFAAARHKQAKRDSYCR